MRAHLNPPRMAGVRRAIEGLPLAYGLAHFGKGLFWYAGKLLFAYFLTDVSGLPPAQMGMVLASGMILGGALDLVIGNLFRNAFASARRAGEMQLAGAISSAFCLIMLFVGAWSAPVLRLTYALLAGAGFRLAYAVYDTGQNALLSLITDDAGGRTRLSAIRSWFSGLATLAIAGAIAPLIDARRHGEGPLGFLALGLVLTFIGIAGAWRLQARLQGMAPGEPVAPPDDHAIGRWGRPWRPPWRIWRLVWLGLISAVAVSIFVELEAYFASYALRSAAWGGMIAMAAAAGLILSQPAWIVIARRSRLRTLRLAFGALALAAAAFGISTTCPPPMIAVAAFGFGAANGGVGTILWARFADELADLKGAEGPAFALLTGISKFGLGIGGLALGAFLGGIDFRGGDSGQLAIAMAAAPMAGAIACLVIMSIDDLPKPLFKAERRRSTIEKISHGKRRRAHG